MRFRSMFYRWGFDDTISGEHRRPKACSFWWKCTFNQICHCCMASQGQDFFYCQQISRWQEASPNGWQTSAVNNIAQPAFFVRHSGVCKLPWSQDSQGNGKVDANVACISVDDTSSECFVGVDWNWGVYCARPRRLRAHVAFGPCFLLWNNFWTELFFRDEANVCSTPFFV